MENIKTLEQRINEQKLKLDRLKSKARKLDTKQKIIIGSFVLSIAKENPNTADWLYNQIKKITNQKDLELINPLVQKIKNSHSNINTPPKFILEPQHS